MELYLEGIFIKTKSDISYRNCNFPLLLILDENKAAYLQTQNNKI
uniref:Uncharacterized protein n=1 Tax=Anguilla anguilla TaxID=7936 RepID=A0A0E9QA66_ANGAN